MSPLAAVPLTAAVPLADSDAGKGSPIGLFVVLLLVVATYLLYRSMSGHLRKLPDRFPGYPAAEPDGTGPTDGAAEPDGAAPADGAAEPDGAAPPAGSVARPDGAAADPAGRPGNPAAEAGERTGPS